MIARPTTHILTRLDLGLRTDSTRLIELENQTVVILERARGLGTEFGSPADWNTAWCHHWDLIEITLNRIHSLVTEMHDYIQGVDPRRLVLALKAWETLQIENSRLSQTVGALRGQALGLNPSTQSEWHIIELEFDDHLETIHACAEALHVKLQLLNQHSTEEVEIQVQSILARLARHPAHQDTRAPDYDEIYQKAAVALKRETNQCLGFMDIVKGMFMWVETTEERTDKMLANTPSTQTPKPVKL